MELGRALPAVAVILAGVIIAVGISLKRYDDAYDWVSHTSDVRLVIGRAIGRLGSLDAHSCHELSGDIDELALLTRDNPIQQTRVMPLRLAYVRACSNVVAQPVTKNVTPTATLLTQLAEADAHERGLLLQRRARLGSVRRWTLFAVIATILGSLGVLGYARTIQHRAMLRVRVLAKKLEEIAVTDELTKLYNRRGFLFVGGQAHLLAKRQKKRVAVLFADLDGLKAINDKLGHERGDEAIREFGNVLKSTLRATDVTARLGGDELVALLYDVDDAHIKGVETRLHAALAEWNARTTGPFKLATSLGVAAPAIDDDRSLDTLLQQADEAMYEQKRARRAARAAAEPAASSNTEGRKSRLTIPSLLGRMTRTKPEHAEPPADDHARKSRDTLS